MATLAEKAEDMQAVSVDNLGSTATVASGPQKRPALKTYFLMLVLAMYLGLHSRGVF